MCNFELSVCLKQNVPYTADEMCLLADQFSEARNTSAQTLCAKAMNVKKAWVLYGHSEVSSLSLLKRVYFRDRSSPASLPE